MPFAAYSFYTDKTDLLNKEQAQQVLQQNYPGFIENKGQIADAIGNVRPDLLFAEDMPGGKIYLRETGFSYVLIKKEGEPESEKHVNIEPGKYLENKQLIKGHRIDVDFRNCNPGGSEIITGNGAGAYYNYYMSHCKEGIKNVRAFNKIIYKNIYPNIDLVFQGGTEKGIKYDIVIRPGGNPDDISIKYIGADGLQVQDLPAGQADSKLKIQSSLGEIIEEMPEVYQNIDGKTVDVKATYQLQGTILNFELSNFNQSFPLVIDPWISYYGGAAMEYGFGIAVDGADDVIITGYTSSPSFPVSTGAFVFPYSGSEDVFIVKLDADGNRIWATCYGGAEADYGYDVVVDGLNNIIVAGITASTLFPVTAGAFQTNWKGLEDLFVLKLGPAGNRIWATYYGGSLSDINNFGCGAVVDASNDIIVSSETMSDDLPATNGIFQTGKSDAYIVKFDANGNYLWSKYFGGSGNDGAHCTAIDNSGNIIISGYTGSSDLPVTPGVFQTKYAGLRDAFIAKFDANGNEIWATFYGGSHVEWAAYGVTVDSQGNVIFAGWTRSGDFPVSPGAFQPIHGGGVWDAFLVKLSSGGTRLWATHFGGTGDEEGWAVAVDSNDNIIFTGDTYSNDLPVTACSYQTLFGGVEDNFIAYFDPNGSRICSGYLGKTGHDETQQGNMLAVKGSKVFITGQAQGANYPVTPGAYQTLYGGGIGDAFVAQLCIKTCGISQAKINFTADKNQVCLGDPVNYTSLINSCDPANMQWLWTFNGGTPAFSTAEHPSGIVYNSLGINTVKLKITSECGSDSLVKVSYISVSGVLSLNVSSTSVTCNGYNNGTAMANGSGGTMPYRYNWTNGETTTGVSNLPPAIYTATVTDKNGCIATATITINEPTQLTLSVSSTSITCNLDNNGTSTVSPSGGTGLYNYRWSNGANTPTIINLPASVYSVTVTDTNNCTAIDSVNIIPGFIVTATVSGNVTISPGDSTILSTSGGVSYAWTPSIGLSCITCYSPTASPAITTIYCVVVTDANGCTDTACVIITVEIPCGKIFVPTAFSPNIDMVNELLCIKGTDCVKSFVFIIYGRWGEKVFETTDPKACWDGKYNDKELNTSVFVYYLKATLTNQEVVEKKGNISLIR